MQRKSGDAKINYAYIIPYYMLNLSSYLIYSIINSYSACTKYVTTEGKAREVGKGVRRCKPKKILYAVLTANRLLPADRYLSTFLSLAILTKILRCAQDDSWGGKAFP